MVNTTPNISSGIQTPVAGSTQPVQKTVRERIREEYTRCALDPAYFLKKYCYIQNPDKGKMLFETFDFQENLLHAYIDHKYNVILKARQLGISTTTAGFALWKMLFTNDYRILVISKDKEAAKEIITMIRYMFEELPSWLKSNCIENNKLSLRFNNGSSIVAFASSPEAGRSKALSLLILDEAAFIKDIDTIWAAAAPSVTSHGTNCIVLSTPNGVGNFFHKIWKKAEENKSLDGLMKFFPTKLPWWVHPEHNQLWRDAQVEILASERLAAQEHDCDFATSGHTVISSEIIAYYREHMIEPPIEREDSDCLWIWEPVDYSRDYVLCADVARGDGSDYSTFHVLDVEKLNQIAEFKAQVSTIEFAHIIASVATKYNNALVVVENSGLGWSTVKHITDVIKYPNVYYSQKGNQMLDAESQIMKNYDTKLKEDMVPGFSMSFKIRPMLISKLEMYMREKAVTIKSSRLLDEITTFIWLNYKPQAQNGYNDDLIMAFVIGLWIRDTALSLRQYGIDLTKSSILASKKITHEYTGIYNSARVLPQYNPYEMQFGNETEDISWILSGKEKQKAQDENNDIRKKYDSWREAYKNPQQ